MKYLENLIKFLTCLVLITGCSPVGNQSSDNTVADINDTLDTKTSAEISSSASSTFTIPPAGQEPYKVIQSVGEVFDQPGGTTRDQQNNPSGYKVKTSISSYSN